MGNACEAGRDGKGMEACEYCESLSLPAWDMDMGRGAVVLLCWGDVVMIGGRGGWLGFEVGEETTGGEVTGEDVVDMTVVIFGLGREGRVPEDKGTSTSTYCCGQCRSQRQRRPTTAMLDCVPHPLSVPPSVYVSVPIAGWGGMRCVRLVGGGVVLGEQVRRIAGLRVGGGGV